jgi:hypothetical protein
MAVSLEGKSDQEIQALAMLAEELAKNPKTRMGFLKLAKERDPSLVIPEIELENRIETITRAERERLEKLEKRLAEDDANRPVYEARTKLKDQGYDAKQIDDIEKLMLEKQIASHETAAEHYKLSQKAAEPTPDRFSQLTMPKLDIPKGMTIQKYARDKAHEAMDDLIKARRG